MQQLAVVLAIQAEHRPVVKVAQAQRAQLDIALALQQRLGLGALGFWDKRHGGLRRQAQQARACIGGQPELNLSAGGRVAPVLGQDKAQGRRGVGRGGGHGALASTLSRKLYSSATSLRAW